LLKDDIKARESFFCVAVGFLKDTFPKGIERLQVWAEAYHSTTSSNPLFEFAVTDEVATKSLDMHPEDVMPFCPIQDAILLNFQVFGDLPESNDERLGTDRAVVARTRKPLYETYPKLPTSGKP
jgi:hypothetical protein